jgi:uncharacterized membrane protein YidH (DUF202 family)
MKLILAIIVVVGIAASIFADWKWRQWMDARRREREGGEHPPNG